MAASLIQKMLQTDPAARPTIHELLNEEFFTSGYIPARLPITCLTVPPRFSLAPSSLDPSSRKPLSILNKGKTGPWATAAPREGLGLSRGCVAPRAGQASSGTGPGPPAGNALPLGLLGKTDLTVAESDLSGPKREWTILHTWKVLIS